MQAAVPEMSKIGTRLYVDVAEFERVLVAARLSKVDERRALDTNVDELASQNTG